MPAEPSPVSAILTSGAVASLSSAATLLVAGRVEGKGAFRPVNATSHWLHGERAAEREAADLAHTGVGYATHLAATVFWAVLFEGLLRVRGRAAGPGTATIAAAATSAVAALVDYRATPKRFTPGWEYVLTRTSMGAAYGAMAVGLVVGRRLAR